jgi:hypothetical protein
MAAMLIGGQRVEYRSFGVVHDQAASPSIGRKAARSISVPCVQAFELGAIYLLFVAGMPG